MALISLLLLAVVIVFIVIASVPLLTEAYEQAKEEVLTSGWRGAVRVGLRTIFWLTAAFLAICFILLLGVFGEGL